MKLRMLWQVSGRNTLNTEFYDGIDKENVFNVDRLRHGRYRSGISDQCIPITNKYNKIEIEIKYSKYK